ncbi:MAG TPA: GntR family transcriptional regulator [Ktedonobacteraceae bacterium]|jgi:DNA-binding GntR family transcriptional regulator|nr:GntR family transcriptional regulator [Ktedonobacteraceae bacterium]
MAKSNQVETISNTIREQILAGAFKPYNVLPTRRALAEQFHTTPDTIAKVIALLQSEGLVSQSGRTVRVNVPRERITTDETFRDYMKAQGIDVVVEHLGTPGVIPMTPELAKAFNMPVGTPVVERGRREIVNGVPYRYSKKYYLASLVDEESLRQIRQDKAFNVRDVIKGQRPLARMHEELIARAITTKEEMSILNAAKGTPVLQLTRINYADDNSVLWVSQVVFIGAYFVKTYDYKPGEEPISEPIM